MILYIKEILIERIVSIISILEPFENNQNKGEMTLKLECQDYKYELYFLNKIYFFFKEVIKNLK